MLLIQVSLCYILKHLEDRKAWYVHIYYTWCDIILIFKLHRRTRLMARSSVHSLKIQMTSHPCNKYGYTTLSYLLSVKQLTLDKVNAWMRESNDNFLQLITGTRLCRSFLRIQTVWKILTKTVNDSLTLCSLLKMASEAIQIRLSNVEKCKVLPNCKTEFEAG